MTELTGQVLGGRYRVEAFIGQGGMADVYKVRDLRRAVFLAMKILHADLAEDQVFIRNFEREAQTLERLQHPNIVRFYGFEKTQDMAFILMDFIDGLTLRREIFLYKNGLRPGRVLEMMQPVCAALYYAHQLGMVHCDIKPANIITHRNGTIYLTDFGIAHRTESTTQPLTGVGSPAYMAPEQFDNKEPTQAVDIYSLGVVMYEMLTGGQRPFTGDSGRASGSTTRRIVWEKKHLEPPSPRTYNPEISTELEAVVMTCLQHNPRRRFRSALDLLQALETAVRGIQPEDDAQTRVDLVKPARPAQPRANLTSQPGAAEPLPAAKPTPKTDKAPAAPGQSSAGAAPAEKPSAAAGKTRVEQSATPPGGKTLLTGVRPGTPPGKTAAETTPPPTPKTQPAAGMPGAGMPAAGVPAAGVPGVEGGPAKSTDKGKPAANRTTPEAGKAQPEARQTSLAAKAEKASAGKESAGKESARRTPVGKTPVGRTSAEKAPQEVKKTGWRQLLNNWMLIGAGVLALALIGMAIFSANARPPGPGDISATTTPPAAAVSGAGIKQTATLAATQKAQSNAGLPAGTLAKTLVKTLTETPVENAVGTAAPADATAEPAATSTPPLGPTATGGSRRIAFASDRSGSVQVWIMDVDNPDDRQQVTNAIGGACQPTWSPDGTRIAFTTPCKGPSIYYPSGTVKIIQLADATITDLPVKTAGIGGTFDPAWSPDGETLLYTAVLGEKTEIRAMNLADKKVTILANQGTKNAQPAWSRDGKYISYIFNNDQNWEALWYMRADGESKELLARSERFSEPVWMPDGLRILASMNSGDNNNQLASVDRTNPLKGAERILSGGYRMSHASISPDGAWVVFSAEKGSEKPEILLASLDGKEIRPLTNNSLRDFHPAWSPK